MKRYLRPLFLVFVLASLLCVSAMADASTETQTLDDGFYLASTSFSFEGVSATIVPISGSGDAVAAKAAKLTTDTGNTFMKFYPGSERLSVTLKGTSSDKQYLVLLVKGGADTAPTGSTITYVDQAGGGTLTFNVYPSEIGESTDLTLWLVSSDGLIGKISLGYWAAKEYTVQLIARGDANGNGQIQANDALAVLLYLAQEPDLMINEYGADANGNGQIQSNDALWILEYLAS